MVETGCQEENQSPSQSKRIKPYGSRVSRASIDEDRIAGTWYVLASVCVNDLHVSEMSEIPPGTIGELAVDFDPDDVTGRSDDFGHDRRVVPDAAAHMDDALSLTEVEGVKAERQIARLSVVQASDRIDCNEDIVVQACGIENSSVFLGRVIAARSQNLPRSWF